MFEDKAFRTQFIVAIFIALGGTLFLVMFLIVFGLKISNSTKDILSQKAEIISKQQKIEAITLLEKNSVSVARYTTILQNALPTKDELITFNQELDSLAKRTGAAISFTFGSETGEVQGGVRGLGFQLVIVGSLDQILNFFREIEKSRFVINISDIDLNRQANTFRGILNGQVYFQSV